MQDVWDYKKLLEFLKDVAEFIMVEIEHWREFVVKWGDSAVYGETPQMFLNLISQNRHTLSNDELGELVRVVMEQSEILTKYHRSCKYIPQALDDLVRQLHALIQELDRKLEYKEERDVSVS